jgi:isopenicillin N synthase-like dioxygenase
MWTASPPFASRSQTEVPALPILDGRLLQTRADQRRSLAGLLADVCCRSGAFYLADPPIATALSGQILEGARAFFDLPAEQKARVHISRSPHFRGYSELHNERDWREQIHFSLERPVAGEPSGNGPAYLRLQGPNLWPASLGEEWRTTALTFLDEVGALGRHLLELLALGLGLPVSAVLEQAQEAPYLLFKLINYHPRPANEPKRPGVAPHCDWSLLTILLQDDVGGLEVQTPAGEWIEVPPLPGTVVVNVGELLEVVTGGVLQATPHRVWNHSARRPRLSLPVFVNPPLPAIVAPPLGERAGVSASPGREPNGHVHRVLEPGRGREPFVFGESEWSRKGLGRWCHNPGCLKR